MTPGPWLDKEQTEAERGEEGGSPGIAKILRTEDPEPLDTLRVRLRLHLGRCR